MKSTQANRGMALENIVSHVNAMYEKKNLAFIQKIPTPIKVMKQDKGIIKHGWFEKKSTVDFMGIAQGYFLAFDCKSTRNKSLPLKNIEQHQLDVLKKVDQQGGYAFLLVEFVFAGEVYVIHYEQIMPWVEEAKQGGRKSIPYDFFVNNCSLVKEDYEIPLDYLTALDKE